MDPYLEHRLREEVIYLHSLWHRGPSSRSLSYTNPQPLNSTPFKKNKKSRKFNTSHHKKIRNFSGTEWPVKPLPADPPVTQSGWPELKLKPNSQTTRLPTPEEVEKHKWNQIQQKALKATKEFNSRNGEESDEEEDENDMDEDDDDDVVDQEYDFFWKLFNEDEELKGYYVKHCGGGGDFSCLVCGGANGKFGKKFKDCIALVQHSISIAKTKKIKSHRAYGKAVCKVLVWDIDRLPSSIVTDHNKSSELQGNDVNVESDLGLDPNGEVHDISEVAIEGESMVCEDSSVVVANVEEENSVKQVLNETEEGLGGAVNNLEPVVNNGAGSSKNIDEVEGEPLQS